MILKSFQSCYLGNTQYRVFSFTMMRYFIEISFKGTRAHPTPFMLPRARSYHTANAVVTATLSKRVPYWQNGVPQYRDVSAETFHSWAWQARPRITTLTNKTHC